jgi:hypothetical protein
LEKILTIKSSQPLQKLEILPFLKEYIQTWSTLGTEMIKYSIVLEEANTSNNGIRKNSIIKCNEELIQSG